MIGRILVVGRPPAIFLGAALFALLSIAPAVAGAQAKDAPAKAEPKVKPVPPSDKAPSAAALTSEATQGSKDPSKPRVIDFEDETIRGTLTKPEGDFIDSRKRARQRSLIKIRRHFVPELLKSADDV